LMFSPSLGFCHHCSALPLALHSFPTRRSSDLDAMPLEEGGDDAPPRVVPLPLGACVDHEPVAVRSLDRGRVPLPDIEEGEGEPRDRKSTRLNSSHLVISYAVFCLKKKTQPHYG